MRFKELVVKTDFEDVWRCLCTYYSDKDENAVSVIQTKYLNIYSQLKTMKSESNELKISIRFNKASDDDDEAYHCVAGVHSFESDTSYGIEFVPWNEWLGMDIEPETEKNYTHSDIVAHCLWEMTFMGKNEAEIALRLAELVDAASDEGG